MISVLPGGSIGSPSEEHAQPVERRLAARARRRRIRSVRDRIGQLLIVIFGISLVLFILLHLSANPAYVIAGPSASPATIKAIEHSLGLDRPGWEQYLVFLRGMLTLNFGNSIAAQRPAFPIVLRHLPYTLELAAVAAFLTFAISLPLGVWLAMRERSKRASVVEAVVIAAQSIPAFVTGLLLIIIFSVHFRVLPTAGAMSADSVVLPAIALSAYMAPKLSRFVRVSASEALKEEYVLIGRSKGLPERYIAFQYVLRNTLTTAVALFGLQLAQLVSGAVIIETLFAWPGMGNLMVTSTLSSDFPVIEATVVTIAVLVSLVNIGVDLVLPFLDPRVRMSVGQSV